MLPAAAPLLGNATGSLHPTALHAPHRCSPINFLCNCFDAESSGYRHICTRGKIPCALCFWFKDIPILRWLMDSFFLQAFPFPTAHKWLYASSGDDTFCRSAGEVSKDTQDENFLSGGGIYVILKLIWVWKIGSKPKHNKKKTFELLPEEQVRLQMAEEHSPSIQSMSLIPALVFSELFCCW